MKLLYIYIYFFFAAGRRYDLIFSRNCYGETLETKASYVIGNDTFHFSAVDLFFPARMEGGVAFFVQSAYLFSFTACWRSVSRVEFLLVTDSNV